MMSNLLLLTLFTSLFSGIFITILSNKIGLTKFCVPFFVFSFVAVGYTLYQLPLFVTSHAIVWVKFFDFVHFDGYTLPCTLVIDSLTAIMIFVVISVSFFVFLFSIWYLRGDPNQLKFLIYLNWFMFFMLLLVAADSLIIAFIGWEGIGIFSYFLINFWNSRLAANRSSIKALAANKVGDIALYLFLTFFYFIFEIFTDKGAKIIAKPFQNDISIILNLNFANLMFICLFISSIAKSAQFFLHVWLPDAMEGPTPVSALLHAATMVTAGAYLLIKHTWLMDASSNAALFIVIIGLLTNFLSSFISTTQSDLKKIIAYSTASQMGLIFVAIGCCQPFLAFYHLFNHAFFKALLFILAGIIIHMMLNKQDYRFFNKLSDKMFFLYSCFLVSCLTLIGTPFLSAYYSKELIINSVFFNLHILPISVAWFLYSSILTTSLYTLKIFIFIFILKGDEENRKKYKWLKQETYLFFSLEIIIVRFITYSLVLASIVLGYLFSEVFYQFDLFFTTYVYEDLFKEKVFKRENITLFFVVMLLYTGFYLFIYMGVWLYRFQLHVSSIRETLNLPGKKFYFDIMYFYIVKSAFIFRNLVREEKNFNEHHVIFYINDKKDNFIKTIKLIKSSPFLLGICLIFMILDLVFIIVCTKLVIKVFFTSIIIYAILKYYKWL